MPFRLNGPVSPILGVRSRRERILGEKRLRALVGNGEQAQQLGKQAVRSVQRHFTRPGGGVACALHCTWCLDA